MELSGRIVTPDGVLPGRLAFGATIDAITPAGGPASLSAGGPASLSAGAVPDRLILPGFIDPHVHGGDGGDAMDGVAGLHRLARFHLRHGTTTLLATTITNPWPDVLAALRAIDAVCREGGTTIAGAHLEGPFINPQRLGAQPPFAIPPDPARVAEAIATGSLRLVTLAPEIDSEEAAAAAAIAAFVRAGVRVNLGHSAASYEIATAALASVAAQGGSAGGTHLFNAMGNIEGRAPGLAGALLASPTAYAELILDLHHVHPGAFRLAHAAIGDRLLLITDAMRGTGLGDGESELGGQRVTIRDGVARLAGGGLAGSVLTMDQALRNAVGAGVPLPAAARLASTNAARHLGLADRGAIRPGLRADFVVLDAALSVTEVWVGGVREV